MQPPKEDNSLALLSSEPGSLWLRLWRGEQSNSKHKRRVWLHPASVLPSERASSLRRREESEGRQALCASPAHTGRVSSASPRGMRSSVSTWGAPHQLRQGCPHPPFGLLPLSETGGATLSQNLSQTPQSFTAPLGVTESAQINHYSFGQRKTEFPM